jgi:hypothetical protein
LKQNVQSAVTEIIKMIDQKLFPFDCKTSQTR